MTAAVRSYPLPPPDDGLPVATMLLDASAMAPHLNDLFVADVAKTRVRYLEYRPGVSLTVQYDAVRVADHELLEAYATASADGWTLHPYPDDPGLPLLRHDAGELTCDLGLPITGSVRRLAWVPNRRAVLRCDDLVVKLYAEAAELDRAERAMKAVAGVWPTAALVTSRRDLGGIVQQALGGRPLGRDDATRNVPGAALLLRRLHRATFVGSLDDLGPASLLAASRPPAELVAFAVPSLAARIRLLSDHLSATLPEGAEAVAVHGDFNVGQLLVDGDQMWVVDVDTLAQGSPSVDLAAYVANLHNGRRGDDANARVALTDLIDAYGRRPDDLMWHLATTMLRRVDRPLRRLKKHWPDRTEAIVSAIEAML